MTPDDASSSVEADRAAVQSWPPTEKEAADTEIILSQIHDMIGQIEQTISQAKVHLAVLSADAPALRQSLMNAKSDFPRLADLQAARGLRAELVKTTQQSVAAAQSAARYLQARERFLLARRAWLQQNK